MRPASMGLAPGVASLILAVALKRLDAAFVGARWSAGWRQSFVVTSCWR